MPRKIKSKSAASTPSKSAGAPPSSAPSSARSLRTRAAKPAYTDPDDSAAPSEAESDDAASGYDEDAGETASESEGDADEDEGVSDEEEAPPRKKRRGDGGAATRVEKGEKGQELWRTSVKAGLGREVVIKKARARSPGATPYTESTIHPNTLLFLGDLAANNDREWLAHNDADYRTAWADFTAFLGPLQDALMEIDASIPELPAKDVFFRIYRDVRFSPDPTPYKAHFSAAWSRTGRKGPFAAYYVQLKPGGCFVGGGLWMPEAQAIAALRRDIDRRPEKIKNVLLDERVRKQLLGGIGPDAKKAVKGFAAQNAESALKRRPKDYAADHRDIELLRLKNFTLGTKLKDEEVLGPKAIGRICEVVRALEPFVTYLNSIVMPDAPEAASDDDEGSSEIEGDD